MADKEETEAEREERIQETYRQYMEKKKAIITEIESIKARPAKDQKDIERLLELILEHVL